MTKAKRNQRFVVIATLFVVCVVIGFAVRHASLELQPNERLMRKSDDPVSWPFSVTEGVLRCAGNPKSPALAAVTFTANGVTYGINGGALAGDVFPSADPITPRNSLHLYVGDYAKYLYEGLDLCKNLPADQQPL